MSMCSLSPSPLGPIYMLRCARGASQDVKLPLHYAAAKGASFEVTELLLDANRDAAAAPDKARSSAQMHCPRCRGRSTCPPSPSSSRTDLLPRPTNAAPRASYTQDGKLPLHYAAAKGALFGVMELLLDANPKAVTEADKARS